MKNAKICIGALLLSAVLFSCSLDDAKEVLDEFVPDMTATIDGQEWKADLPAAQLKDGKFIITGTAVSGKTLVITVNGTTADTYELGLTSAQCAAVYKESVNTSTEDAYLSVTGNVVLTSVNTTGQRLSGTFSFTVTRGISETFTIANGVFDDIKYTVAQ